jgi:hypothetical protein
MINRVPQQPFPVQIHPGPSNPRATAAMVLGIIAAVFGIWAWVPLIGLINSIIAIVPAILAVMFGHVGLTVSRELNGLGRGKAKAGLILGYAAIAIIALVTIVWIVAITTGENAGA